MARRVSDEMDTIAYAVSFMQAATVLSKSDDKWGDNHALIVPFYMLIGFALENGLKAVLEFKSVDRSLKWFHSHDLAQLLDLAKKQGLVLPKKHEDFALHLSQAHVEHHFRYPQKADVAFLLKPPTAVVLTEEIMTKVFLFIGGPQRV